MNYKQEIEKVQNSIRNEMVVDIMAGDTKRKHCKKVTLINVPIAVGRQSGNANRKFYYPYESQTQFAGAGVRRPSKPAAVRQAGVFRPVKPKAAVTRPSPSNEIKKISCHLPAFGKGNPIVKELVQPYLAAYASAKNRNDKNQVILQAVSELRKNGEIRYVLLHLDPTLLCTF